MRQEQIQRRPRRHGGPDTPDDIPVTVPESAAKASRDASDLITRIDRETDS